MIDIFFLATVMLSVAIKPTLIPYLCLSYLFMTGVASREFVADFKLSLGHVNMFPLDFLYVSSFISFSVYTIKFLASPGFRSSNSKETNSITLLILAYLTFFIGKLLNGFFNNVPADSLVRLFITDTQIFYFFVPLLVYKDIKPLSRLLKFVVFISLLFPICQPFLINSDLTRTMLKSQGTFRLGFGDANVFLGIGAVALFCWDYKKYLAFLPLSGILMLAHRSAYISIIISLFVVSILRGKKFKTIMMMGIAGLFVILMRSSDLY